MFYHGLGAYSSNVGAQISANAAESNARRARTQVTQTKWDIERLLMITEALWMILKEEHGYDDDELLRRVMEIDLRDGKLDGKVAAEENPKCPYCERPLAKKRPHCLYCGKPVTPDLFAR